MLAKDIRGCLCGVHNWGGGGGEVSPGFTSTQFRCKECDRYAVVLSTSGCGPFLLMDRYANIKAGDSMFDYINEVLTPACRAAEANNKEEGMLPPRLPDNLMAWVRRIEDEPEDSDDWLEIDHEFSQSLLIPIDPIRKRHDSYWKEIIDELGVIVKEVPNRYYKDTNNIEPWYKCDDHLGAEIIFGPRKRVVSLSVYPIDKEEVKEFGPLDFTEIRELAASDKVTFNDRGFGGIEIHAWNREKFVEYFRVIEKALKQEREKL